MKKFIIFFLSKLYSSYLFLYNQLVQSVGDQIYTVAYKNKFMYLGEKVCLRRKSHFLGENFIEIGAHTKIGRNCNITAWSNLKGQKESPSLVIGNNCNIGQYCHITCISKIKLGDSVLLGRWVTITDNSHGKTDSIDMILPPSERPIFTKGPVVIEDNVWIGDKATILPGVTIGANSIIGANSVVTKNVPPYSVACGNPAIIIKTIEF